jgi:glucose/arabinose dehydrogenase
MKSKTHSARNIVLLIALGLVIMLATAVTLKLLLGPPDQPAAQSTPIKTLKTPAVSTKLVASGLQSPTGIISTGDSSDKRLFVIERSGTIRIVTPGDKSAPQMFLDIQNKVQAGGEMGLLGLAFHPDYAQNGYFFINYVDKDQNTVIARYKVSSDKNKADPNSEKVLLTLKQPYTNHNGGDLAFGPDGYLYAATGDGGSAGDPENRAQDKSSLFGKILRLDINKGDPYDIPVTNPFAQQTDAEGEIWAYGLRNPWRISFDKSTGDLYIADVGQGSLEEIDLQKANSKGGENYGWRCYEGNQPYQPAGCESADKYTAPVIEYNHDENRCSITGGYVYRGKENPAFIGKYFYGDYCNGQLFYAAPEGDKWTQTLAAKTDYSISTFGQGSDGELYVADFKTGNIYKLEDSAN